MTRREPGLNGDIKPFCSRMSLILRLTFKGGKTHIEDRKDKHRCN